MGGDIGVRSRNIEIRSRFSFADPPIVVGHAGRAGLQGLLQQAGGGKFITGLANSALASMGSEITAHLDAQIRQMRLSDGERSMMGLFSRAAGSAVRIAGSGDLAL